MRATVSGPGPKSSITSAMMNRSDLGEGTACFHPPRATARYVPVSTPGFFDGQAV